MNFCGRYGFSFWPIWSFRVADVVVADMVQTRLKIDVGIESSEYDTIRLMTANCNDLLSTIVDAPSVTSFKR